MPKLAKLAVIPENHAMHAPWNSNVSFTSVIDVKRVIIVTLYIIIELYIKCNLFHSYSIVLDIVPYKMH